MTHSHTLAATIARAILDRIERDRALILQNIEEVVREQLAIEGARRYKSHPTGDRIFADPRAFEERVKLILGPLIKTKPHPFAKPDLPSLPDDAEGFYGDDWK